MPKARFESGSETVVKFAAALLTLMAAAMPAAGHHSFSAEFDAATVGTIEGVVTEVRWSNPHVRYYLDVEGGSGDAQSWELQTFPTTILERRNWPRGTISVGDAITVHGSLARDGSSRLYITWVDAEGLARLTPAVGDNTLPSPEEAAARRYGTGQSPRPHDISGTWRNNYQWQFTVDDLEPKPTPFTEETRRQYENSQFGDDPGLRCQGLGLPRLFGGPVPMEIIDVGPYYLIAHGVAAGASVRRIYMDGREQPLDREPTLNGFSTGSWENDALIIETTLLAAGWLDGSGLPFSGEDTRIVETWTPAADGLTMERVMVVHDSMYTAPLTRRRASARADVDVIETICDPDGFYEDLMKQGLLEDYFLRERL